MKKWSNPQITIEEYVANDYVAACGDGKGKEYKVACDTGTLFTNLGDYYLEDDNVKGLSDGDKKMSSSSFANGLFGAHSDSQSVYYVNDSDLLDGYYKYRLQNRVDNLLIWKDSSGHYHSSNQSRSQLEVVKS